MQVFIYAEEGYWHGTQNVYDMGVFDINSTEEATDIGCSMIENLIENYSYDWEVREKAEEDSFFQVFKIKDSINLSTHTLTTLCNAMGEEEFKDFYCEEKEWYY